MGVAERSRERIKEKLVELEEGYGSFPVNQTNLALPNDQYTSMRERGNPEPVAAYLAVYNDDDEILHVIDDGNLELPGVQLPLDASLEPALRRKVENIADIDCAVDNLDQVTIAGLRNGDDPDAGTLYNLVVVFHGRHKAGVPGEHAEWSGTTETVTPAYA